MHDIIHNLASHDHLQGIGAPHSPEHIAVRASFRQKSQPSRDPQKPDRSGFTISGEPAPSCSKIQALRIKPSATTLTTLMSSRMHFALRI